MPRWALGAWFLPWCAAGCVDAPSLPSVPSCLSTGPDATTFTCLPQASDAGGCSGNPVWVRGDTPAIYEIDPSDASYALGCTAQVPRCIPPATSPAGPLKCECTSGLFADGGPGWACFVM